MEEWPPPWIALPDLSPDDPATHGLAEVYISLSWCPYWQTLSPGEKAEYLDRWQATREWRDAIATRYDPDVDGLEHEAREAGEHLAQHGPFAPHQPWWRFWR